MVFCAPRVLVADNDPDFAATLRDLIRREGYRVHVATTANEIRDLTRRWRFAVAIIDVKMGDESKWDWSGLVEARLLTMPVLIISAYDSPEEIEAVFKVAPGIRPPKAFISKNRPQWFAHLRRHLYEIAPPCALRRWLRRWFGKGSS